MTMKKKKEGAEEMGRVKQPATKRTRVILSKPSHDLLVELNNYAATVGKTVVIGLDEHANPVYIIGDETNFTNNVAYAISKEEVLEKIILTIDVNAV